MAFCTDRNLLAFAPNVFNDAAWASQQSVSLTDGDLNTGELTSPSADFGAAGVNAGGVVLIDETPYEVLERIDGNTLSVSLIRPDLNDPAIPGRNVQAAGVVVRSFMVQAEVVHDTLMRRLGLDPGAGGSVLPEDVVLSVSSVARLEALGTLEWVYRVAAAADPSRPGLGEYAEAFASRFGDALRTTAVHLDLDGDGYAEQRVRLGNPELNRI